MFRKEAMTDATTHTLIILAAGASSRMRRSMEEKGGIPSSFSGKALIPVGDEGRPAIDFLIDNAVEAGMENIVLVVPEASEGFQAHFSKKSYGDLKLRFAIQKIPQGRVKPLGTADAVLQCLDQFPELKNESILVCNGDNLYSVEAFKALLASKYNNALIGYDREGLEFSMERIAAFALLELDGHQRLVSIIEKPRPDEVQRYKMPNGKLLVSMNIWKFESASLYPFLVTCPINPIRNEKELPAAVLNMIQFQKSPLYVVQRKEHVPDLTAAEDIEKVTAYLRKNKS